MLTSFFMRKLFLSLGIALCLLGGVKVSTAFAGTCAFGCFMSDAPGVRSTPRTGTATCEAASRTSVCGAECGRVCSGLITAASPNVRCDQASLQCTGTSAPTGGGTPTPPPRAGACGFQCVRGNDAAFTPVFSQTCGVAGECTSHCERVCTAQSPTATCVQRTIQCVGGTAAAGGAPAPAPAPAAGGGAAASAPSGGLRFSLPACTETGNCSLTDIVNTAIRGANFLMGVSGILFLGIALYAGLSLLIFAQEKDSIDKAKKMMEGAVMGIVIIMIAGVAVRFVSSSLGVNATATRLPGTMQRAPVAAPPATGSGTPR